MCVVVGKVIVHGSKVFFNLESLEVGLRKVSSSLCITSQTTEIVTHFSAPIFSVILNHQWLHYFYKYLHCIENSTSDGIMSPLCNSNKVALLLR